MKILAVDTSAVSASAAIVENDKIISLCYANAGLTHSKTTLPMVDFALKSGNTSLDEIDFFACANGPGSFTGIRIGISTIKGLADGKNKKCVGVSTLLGLAYNLLGQNVTACCVMDARCSQVYCALFKIKNSTVTRLTPDEAISISDLGERLRNIDGEIVFLGDGAELCHEKLGYALSAANVRMQNAASVAFAAQKEAQNGNLLTAAQLMPVYLRLPQAERELKKLGVRN